MSSPAFQFYPAEFLTDENVSLMSNQEIGCYVKLLCFCWRERSIPAQIDKLAKLCGEDSSAMAQLWLSIKPCFIIDQINPGRLIHSRLDKEREKQEAFKKERSDAGKKGAAIKSNNKIKNINSVTSSASAQHIANASSLSLSLSSSLIKPPPPKSSSSISEEWNFDLTLFEKFGFGTDEIKKIAALKNLSADQVQQSLIEFNYDVENNALPKIKTDKLNFLMGIFRKGSIYSSVGFTEAQDKAIIEMATRTKAKQEKLLESKFILWESSLNEDERKTIIENILPSHLLVLYLTHGSSNSKVKKWLFDKYSAGDLG